MLPNFKIQALVFSQVGKIFVCYFYQCYIDVTPTKAFNKTLTDVPYSFNSAFMSECLK